jgi:hypothetical protein
LADCTLDGIRQHVHHIASNFHAGKIVYKYYVPNPASEQFISSFGNSALIARPYIDLSFNATLSHWHGVRKKHLLHSMHSVAGRKMTDVATMAMEE